MKRLYVNTVLQTYRVMDDLVEQIDELIIKKGYASGGDYSPAFEQCVKVVQLGFEKQKIIELKRKVDLIVERLTDDEKVCLDYKFFKKNPTVDYGEYDFKSRNYYRKQMALSLKMGKFFDYTGLTDKVFEEEYLTMDFFREVVKRIKSEMTNRSKSGGKNATKKTDEVRSGERGIMNLTTAVNGEIDSLIKSA